MLRALVESMGTQEECWRSAEFVVKKILDPEAQDEHAYGTEASVGGYAPRYLHEALIESS